MKNPTSGELLYNAGVKLVEYEQENARLEMDLAHMEAHYSELKGKPKPLGCCFAGFPAACPIHEGGSWS